MTEADNTEITADRPPEWMMEWLREKPGRMAAMTRAMRRMLAGEPWGAVFFDFSVENGATPGQAAHVVEAALAAKTLTGTQ